MAVKLQPALESQYISHGCFVITRNNTQVPGTTFRDSRDGQHHASKTGRLLNPFITPQGMCKLVQKPLVATTVV